MSESSTLTTASSSRAALSDPMRSALAAVVDGLASGLDGKALLADAETVLGSGNGTDEEGAWLEGARGLVQLCAGEDGAAVKTLRGVSKALPSDPAIQLALAVAMARTGRLDKASAQLAEASEDPAAPAAILFNRALLNRSGEDEDLVIDLLSRASALDPNYFEALLELARAYLEAERPVDAEPVFRQTLALQPDNLDCLVGLAETLILLERFDEARSLLEAPARERRLTPHALMELGRCRDEDGDPDLALASYRAAVSGDQALFSDAIERFIQMGRGAPWRHPARLSEVLALARAALV